MTTSLEQSTEKALASEILARDPRIQHALSLIPRGHLTVGENDKQIKKPKDQKSAPHRTRSQDSDSTYKPRLANDPEKIEEIKRLWSGGKNRKEIAAIIGYPKRTTAANITKMIEKGELEDRVG